MSAILKSREFKTGVRPAGGLDSVADQIRTVPRPRLRRRWPQARAILVLPGAGELWSGDCDTSRGAGKTQENLVGYQGFHEKTTRCPGGIEQCRPPGSRRADRTLWSYGWRLKVVIPNARLKFYKRVSSLQKLVDAEQTPTRLVRTLLYLWQAKSFPELLPKRAPWGSAQLAEEPAVKEFAEWLDKQPFDEAAYWFATLYSKLVEEDVRTERAMFFTPPRLAERVIADLEKHGASIVDHKWHDPACGGSAFLVPLALRMKSELEKQKISEKEKLKRIARSLSGNDLDKGLLEISNALLQIALYPLIKASKFIPRFQLSNTDGLRTSGRGKRYDVIICNPPYRKLRASEVERYWTEYGSIIEGQPNIYGLFIHRALQLSRRGGLIGLLTPTSFLSGHSFSKLRRHLTTNAPPLQFDMLGNRTSMFIDVLQETAISVLKLREDRKTDTPQARVNVLADDGQFSDVGACSLPGNGDPWPIPRSADDAELLKLAEAGKCGLSQYGYAAKVGHLVGYRDLRERFDKCPKRPGGKVIVPLIWATDIAPNGRFEHGRDHKIKRNAAFVAVGSLAVRGLVRQAAVLLQRLTSSDQRSRLIAAPVPTSWVTKYGGFVCENHVIVLEPQEKPAIPVETMAALLNTEAVDRVFRSISSANNVGVSELRKLMLPNPEELLRQLSSGKEIESAARFAYGWAPR